MDTCSIFFSKVKLPKIISNLNQNSSEVYHFTYIKKNVNSSDVGWYGCISEKAEIELVDKPNWIYVFVKCK